MAQTIDFVFSGRTVQIKTKGFSGAACQQETAEVEKALGTKTSDKRTEEYFSTSTVKSTSKA